MKFSNLNSVIYFNSNYYAFSWILWTTIMLKSNDDEMTSSVYLAKYVCLKMIFFHLIIKKIFTNNIKLRVFVLSYLFITVALLDWHPAILCGRIAILFDQVFSLKKNYIFYDWFNQNCLCVILLFGYLLFLSLFFFRQLFQHQNLHPNPLLLNFYDISYEIQKMFENCWNNI